MDMFSEVPGYSVDIFSEVYKQLEVDKLEVMDIGLYNIGTSVAYEFETDFQAQYFNLSELLRVSIVIVIEFEDLKITSVTQRKLTYIATVYTRERISSRIYNMLSHSFNDEKTVTDFIPDDLIHALYERAKEDYFVTNNLFHYKLSEYSMFY